MTTEVRGRSIKLNFGWNFVGAVTYSFAQWVLLVVLARLTNASVVGQFSLILAVAAPIFLTIGMNLRTLQATDASRRWRMREYLTLCHLLNLIAVLLTLGIGYVAGVRGAGFLAIAAIALAKCVESVSQTYYGYFQQNERLDLVARSLLLRSMIGPALFALGIVLGHELVWGCLGLLVGWLIPTWLADKPSAQLVSEQTGTCLGKGQKSDWPSVRAIARKGFPLGLDAGISSLAINLPRYAVNSILGAASLGVYSALSYLAQTIQLVTSSLAGALIPRLAVYHHQGRRRDFVRLLSRLTAFGMAVMVVAVAGAVVLGEPFVRLTLGPEYVNQKLLIALMLSAGVITLQRSLCKSLEASWRFKTYLVVDGVTTGAIALLAPVCIHAWGLVGAAVALAAGFGLGTLVVAVALVDLVRSMPSVPPSE